jgi:hypothetical protein
MDGAVFRREVLAALGGLLTTACSPPPPPARVASPSPPPEPSLHLDPLAGIVPAASLAWLVEARPRELLANPDLIPAVGLLVPESGFDAFAARHGGVDLREATELEVACYPEATLFLVRVPVDPARVESAFTARALTVEGRASTRGVTRLWGSVAQGREQVAVFGRQAVGLEHGHLGPLRAAIYFSEGLLSRALPALAAEPLAEAAKRLGPAPLRAFAPGPFQGAWTQGLGGLLRATTALAVGAWPVAKASALRLRALLTGGWGDDAPAATQRLKAAFEVLATDPLGRLSGLGQPLQGPDVAAEGGALRLDVTLDAMALARGLHDATASSVGELMGR